MACTDNLSRETEPKISECQMLTDNHNQVWRCVLDVELEQSY